MSLYGLDIIESQDGQRYLLEMNGINSGMNGFEQIYGDNRAWIKVFHMLEKKYGKNLTLNDGTFSRNNYKKKHPVKFAWNNVMYRVPVLNRVLYPIYPVLLSNKAEIGWLNEKAPDYGHPIPFNGFERYVGQESTVINSVNQRLSHPTVNDFVAEEIVRNKLLNYILLEDSKISESQVPSSFVGMGITHEAELERLIATYKNFVIKPILGSQGRGVKFLSADEVGERYRNSSGSFKENPNISLFDHSAKKWNFSCLEEMICANDFTFEYGISVIQPFIDSRKNIDDEYSSIRAIVCNNKFVDAYKRVSRNPRVNLSQDAKAVSFNYDLNFAKFCQDIVKTFERKVREQDPDSFRETIYKNYLGGMGRHFDQWRMTVEGEVANFILNIVVKYVGDKDKPLLPLK